MNRTSLDNDRAWFGDGALQTIIKNERDFAGNCWVTFRGRRGNVL